MRVQVIPAKELTDEHLLTWSQIQRANFTLRSPYFCPEFTSIVAAVRGSVWVGLLEERGDLVGFFPFERRRMRVGRPVGGPLSDYHGLICSSGKGCVATELLEACGLVAWDFDHLLASQICFRDYHAREAKSPVIDLSRGADAYKKQLRERGSREISQVQRKIRKFEREVAPLRFEPSVHDPVVLRKLMAWKSAQCRRTGAPDIFGRRWTMRVMELIHARNERTFAGMLSVLYAGEAVVAAHFGLRSRAVLHWWFPSYDRRFARYSPGLLLLLTLIQQAHALGLREIDLGKGDERYKASFANGQVTIAEGAIECPSIVSRFRRMRREAEARLRAMPLSAVARVPYRLVRRYQKWRKFR